MGEQDPYAVDKDLSNAESFRSGKKNHLTSLASCFSYDSRFYCLYPSGIDIARTKTSFLDEGLYVYKGCLFANGAICPFADYGVWTNHAILSFLIPGYIQKWFGPGLDTGRYFMIFLSLLTLLGLVGLCQTLGQFMVGGGHCLGDGAQSC